MTAKAEPLLESQIRPLCMYLDCWMKVEHMVKTSILLAMRQQCYPYLLFTSKIRRVVFLMQADCCTNKPFFQIQIPQNSTLLQVSDEKIKWSFRVWRCDDHNLPVNQSLIRQLFTEITVKKKHKPLNIVDLSSGFWVDHHQSLSSSPEMNDWCGFSPCQPSHLQSLNPLQKPWVISRHTGSRARWHTLQDLSVI